MEYDASFHDEHTELVLDVVMMVAQTGQVWLVRWRSRSSRSSDSLVTRARMAIALLARMVVAVVPGAFVDNHAVPHVLEEERQKYARHGDCSGSPFVGEATQAGVVEHEMGVGEELSS